MERQYLTRKATEAEYDYLFNLACRYLHLMSQSKVIIMANYIFEHLLCLSNFLIVHKAQMEKVRIF